MLPMRIGLSSRSASVGLDDLTRVASAIAVQVARDAGPLWSISAIVSALADPDRVDPGIWPVEVVDVVEDGLSGFHQTRHNQPFARVLAGTTWSLTASHEILEMLVDPSGNRLVAAPAVAIVDNDIQDAPGKFEYLLEVCDASEGPKNAYLIDGVLVSDFYTPNYFDPSGSAGARYSFSGNIKRPRQVLPDGYLTWFDAQTNSLRQVRHFGAPEIVDLASGLAGEGSLTGGVSLRTFVDARTRSPVSLSRLHPGSAAVQARSVRESALAAIAPRRASLYRAAIDALEARQAEAAAHAAAAPIDVARVLAGHLTMFRNRPGILSVRPGRRLRGNALMGEAVIVVTVTPDAASDIAAALPASLDAVPIDIRTASALQMMRATAPTDYLTIAEARHELRQPDFPDQSFFDLAGAPVAPAAPLAAVAAGP